MAKTQVINPGWSRYEKLTFSPAVRRGNLLFISGQTGTDETGKLVEGGMVAQCRQAYKNIEAILKAAGATFDNVVMTTDYLTTTEGYRDTAEVRREVFKGHFPASTGIIVKGLLRAEALIEIDVIAVLD